MYAMPLSHKDKTAFVAVMFSWFWVELDREKARSWRGPRALSLHYRNEGSLRYRNVSPLSIVAHGSWLPLLSGSYPRRQESQVVATLDGTRS
jgi:hypothetical protein